MPIEQADSRSPIVQWAPRAGCRGSERIFSMQACIKNGVFGSAGVSKTVTARPRARCQGLHPGPSTAIWAHFPAFVVSNRDYNRVRGRDSSLVAGRPAPGNPSRDACAPMAASARPVPLTLRATYRSLQIYLERHRKGEAVAFEASARSGRTSSRSRCLARRAPAPACRAAPNTFRIWGFQEGGAKNGDGNAPDWAHSR